MKLYSHYTLRRKSALKETHTHISFQWPGIKYLDYCLCTSFSLAYLIADGNFSAGRNFIHFTCPFTVSCFFLFCGGVGRGRGIKYVQFVYVWLGTVLIPLRRTLRTILWIPFHGIVLYIYICLCVKATLLIQRKDRDMTVLANRRVGMELWVWVLLYHLSTVNLVWQSHASFPSLSPPELVPCMHGQVLAWMSWMLFSRWFSFCRTADRLASARL